ncbi:ATP-binding protein [Ferruginibacter sp.]
MEVFNWGTFDETIHSIHPGGETSLLTGANGSGKTTFVDALLTLIVPEKRYRFYNQSSGSEKKGDRTEETYLLGGYGSINTESGSSTKTLYLRENKETAYSIILAHFANEAEHSVTLFQVRYFVNADMKKYYGIAHKQIKIEDDFKPFDLGGNWKRTIDQRYNKGPRKFVEWFDTASKYAQRIVTVLGMQSIQALQLFNQTVGIKVLGNLDDFIRTHMLEYRNIEEQFQELKKHLSTLLDARRNIEKCEEQLSMLTFAKKHFEKYTAAQEAQQKFREMLDTGVIWHKYTRYSLLFTVANELIAEIAVYTDKIQLQEKEVKRLSEEGRQLRNQIDQNEAGKRLQHLERELRATGDKKDLASSRLGEFNQWVNKLHLTENNISDEASYLRVKKENDRKSLTLEREQRLNGDDEYDSRKIAENGEREKAHIENELNGMLLSKSNIPLYLVEIRRKISEALGIATDELPFAGELMQVKSEELSWQPALEKLLRPFCLRLAVPDKHYKKVSKYVNKENLRNRLVYEHVRDTTLNQLGEEGTVHEKLEFNPDQKLSKWANQQIIRLYDYACVEDERTFDRFDKAVTINGLSKNGQRHEKDDRASSNDPLNYVMGWNNERKQQALLKRRDILTEEIGKAREVLYRCQAKLKRLQEQFYANNRIKEHPGFEELNVAGLQLAMHKIKEQLDLLTKEDKALSQLKRQLEEIEKSTSKASDLKDQYVRSEAVAKEKQESIAKQIIELTTVVQEFREEDKDKLLKFQQQHNSMLSSISLDNLDEKYRSFRDANETEMEKKTREVTDAEKALSQSLYKIKNPPSDIINKYPDWLGDVTGLPEDVKYAGEYMEWMEKLTTENLPKYKKDFENYINVTITYKIGGLNEELEKWERDVSLSITRLNESLRGINFNRMPDTYVQLRKQAVPAGTEVRQFRTELLDALPQAANWQQSSFEEKSQHFNQKIHPLIESLDANENYRNKVLDVRNWFEFWADEKYRSTEELKKTYRQMGQLSGGEKAQLTYTILCSAIAYQFGITKEGKNSKSLRFIAVDESFSNQDEEKATYLMELCKQLHLQLLVVTPSDKIQIVQDFIAHVHLVQRVNNRNSVIYNMTIKELKDKMENV